MPDHEPDNHLLSGALGPADNCPSLEDLERLLEAGAPAALKGHIDQCPYCRTELEMLRSFTSNQIAEHEELAVNAIAARLKTRPPIHRNEGRAAVESRHARWKRLIEVRWLSPAAATLAIALMVFGVALEVRRGRQPAIDVVTGTTEVLRSSAIAILSPLGDLREKPTEIRWEPVPDVVRYRVRIMEVDRAELWSSDTTSPRIGLPPTVETLMVPSKTLLVQIAAFGASGQKVAESETMRFRLLQKVYTH